MTMSKYRIKKYIDWEGDTTYAIQKKYFGLWIEISTGWIKSHVLKEFDRLRKAELKKKLYPPVIYTAEEVDANRLR